MNKLKIGTLQLNTNAILSPMAGITDYVLRSLVRSRSKTCLLTTEMISSEALINESKCKKRDMISENDLIKRDGDHFPISYQITGHKPKIMAAAAKLIEDRADIIDVNMGCPVKKVVGGNDGCALMRTPKVAMDIVKALKDSVSCPVTIKCRLGFTQDEMNFVEFGQMMQDAGADMITLHARTRKQMYAGEADWAKIAELKKAVDIPVIANGDIRSVEDAKKCLEISNANGVAIGRAAMGDIDLINRIEHFIATGEILPEPSFEENIDNLKVLLKKEIELRGDDIGVKFSRKFYPFYISGIRNAAKLRADLVIENDYSKIIEYLDNIICDMSRPFVS